MKPCRVALLLCILSLLALVGCGKSSTTPDPVPVDPWVTPSTADKLMQDFQLAYESMDPARLARITDPQSIIVLQASTAATFPDVGATLDRTEQARIASRMFSKQDVVDPIGHLVAGIQTVQFQTFQRVGSWGMSLPSDVIPNTEYALYSVQVLFDRGQANPTIKVTGNIKFYASHHDTTISGQLTPYYKIVGQVDLTDGSPYGAPDKPAETSAWGSVHALFR